MDVSEIVEQALSLMRSAGESEAEAREMLSAVLDKFRMEQLQQQRQSQAPHRAMAREKLATVLAACSMPLKAREPGCSPWRPSTPRS